MSGDRAAALRNTLEEELKGLATNPRGWWIFDNAKTLMGLSCVKPHIRNAADDDDRAEAVRRYLEGAVDRVENRQHKVILQIVMGHGDNRWRDRTWRDKPANERRAEAGRLFRGGERPVAETTIRQTHLQRAIDDLLNIVVSDESATA